MGIVTYQEGGSGFGAVFRITLTVVIVAGVIVMVNKENKKYKR